MANIFEILSWGAGQQYQDAAEAGDAEAATAAHSQMMAFSEMARSGQGITPEAMIPVVGTPIPQLIEEFNPELHFRDPYPSETQVCHIRWQERAICASELRVELVDSVPAIYLDSVDKYHRAYLGTSLGKQGIPLCGLCLLGYGNLLLNGQISK